MFAWIYLQKTPKNTSEVNHLTIQTKKRFSLSSVGI